jgi:glutamine amidotransferase
MIGIINYGAGNIFSLQNSLERIGAAYCLINTVAEFDKADKYIIPGVGHAKPAMEKLLATSLVEVIKETQKPLLGICLGMQLLTTHSEEGDTDLLGILPLQTKKFTDATIKIPHTGWNAVSLNIDNPLFKKLSAEEYFYFVHSYFVEKQEQYAIATTYYQLEYASAIQKNNFYGVQFHPEKSGKAGEQVLKNFSLL